MTICEPVPAPPFPNYNAEETILYGFKLYETTEEKGRHKGDAIVNVKFGNDELDLRVKFTTKGQENEIKPSSDYAIAVIYGYAYDGHCYRFDKPRIFAFKPTPTSEAAAEGCGFGDGYTMWRVRKSDTILELNASADTVATLVLEANLPGKRAPDTYRSAMQLTHRGGRLTST